MIAVQSNMLHSFGYVFLSLGMDGDIWTCSPFFILQTESCILLNSPLGGAKTPRNEEAGLADFMAAKHSRLLPVKQ